MQEIVSLLSNECFGGRLFSWKHQEMSHDCKGIHLSSLIDPVDLCWPAGIVFGSGYASLLAGGGGGGGYASLLTCGGDGRHFPSPPPPILIVLGI